MACHRHVLAIEAWQGKRGYAILYVIDRLVQCLQTTEMVDERPQSDRPPQMYT